MQDLKRRQRFAFEHFKEGAAAGGDVAHFFSTPYLVMAATLYEVKKSDRLPG
ncbi:MAG: hypothetical protein LW719_09775 [Comamonadaceae bacterium]|nr:hypothetical protein [Comamonadaceae bacterium]